jgi:citrate synthase
LAARVAASARADPYGVVGAGLGPFSGTLHGAASRHVRGLLDRAEVEGPSVALAEALQLHRHVPGFGHPLYPHGDPRAAALWRRLDGRWAGHERMAVVESVRSLAMERTQVHPNIDFALGAMGHLHGLDHDAGEALFGVARAAGWIAHAIEEYGERPLRFRPRARYVGPAPRELTVERPPGRRTPGGRR